MSHLTTDGRPCRKRDGHSGHHESAEYAARTNEKRRQDRAANTERAIAQREKARIRMVRLYADEAWAEKKRAYERDHYANLTSVQHAKKRLGGRRQAALERISKRGRTDETSAILRTIFLAQQRGDTSRTTLHSDGKNGSTTVSDRG